MGWRKIRKEDLKIGLVVLIRDMVEDGSFGMCVIIGVYEESWGVPYQYVKFARPYAYAPFTDIDSNQPLLGAEVFGVSVDRLLDTSYKSDMNNKTYYEVFENSKGDLRMSVVNPA